ncbi:MAG: GNAT family N-acetyltransferase [Bacillota bacterium]
MTLYANASNTRPLALYEKAGFVREGLLRHELKDGDRYEDAVVMGLLF